MAKESYIVDGVHVELESRSATLTRGADVKEIKAKTRNRLLVKVGDSLADDYGIANSHIWGLYNVVSLQE